jgi:hypothetical protein
MYDTIRSLLVVCGSLYPKEIDMINLLQKCASCGISLEDDLNILCEQCQEQQDSQEPDLDDYESEEDYE